MTEKSPTSYCVAGVCQPLGSFLLDSKTEWSLRGVVQCSDPEMGIFPGRASTFHLRFFFPSSSFPFWGPFFTLTCTHLPGSFILFIIYLVGFFPPSNLAPPPFSVLNAFEYFKHCLSRILISGTPLGF